MLKKLLKLNCFEEIKNYDLLNTNKLHNMTTHFGIKRKLGCKKGISVAMKFIVLLLAIVAGLQGGK